MQFRVLGPVAAHTDEGVPIVCGGRKPGVLLAALLCHANKWVGVDQLIAAIWHEQVVPAAATAAVRNYARALRRAVGERLECGPGTYRLRVLPGELDAEQARTMAAAAREALAAGSADEAIELLTGALALWRGAPLDGLGCAIARSTATRLDELHQELSTQLAAARRPTGRLTLVSDNSPTVGRAGLDALLASARREVLIISGSGNARFGRLDHENLRRGVRYRVLFPDTARLSGPLNQLSLAGAEVRTEAEVPMEGMVIDGMVAVLPADGAGAAVFRLPGVVASTVGLFERIWPGAAPLIPADPDAVGPGLTSRERALLDLLCSGATDESAGARLGISVRTVRRMVADVMNRLGARSRFQAGVKLADRGWLLERAG
ncbi:MAG TPA: BTAD domain-containing putative transcriptional regulator [Pseudonocardiaceae bacterium]|jgi:DNA-binding CsgD family transcriptional regulator|nr:BTAD domain-containing putative transcriptional regulator [Pseudonocardiaceae bacterium]